MKRVEVHFKVLVFGFQLHVVLAQGVCFNFEVEQIVGHVFDVFLVQALGMLLFEFRRFILLLKQQAFGHFYGGRFSFKQFML